MASCSRTRRTCPRGSAAWCSPAWRTTPRPWRRWSAWASPAPRAWPRRSAAGTTAASPPPAPSAGRELFTRLAPRLLDRPGRDRRAGRRLQPLLDLLRRAVGGRADPVAVPGPARAVRPGRAGAWPSPRVWPRPWPAIRPPWTACWTPASSRRWTEDSGVLDQLVAEAVGESDFEEAMDAVRRIHRDQTFRIGVQMMTGRADADSAGRAFADLADVCSPRPVRGRVEGSDPSGRRLPGTHRGGGAGQGRLARDDRRLRPRPDDALSRPTTPPACRKGRAGAPTPSTAASPSG